MTNENPFTPKRHREIVQTFRELHGQQHIREFDLACLMSDVLSTFEKRRRPTADASFCAYVGQAFNPSGSSHRNLPGGTRKKYLLMGKEARRFKKVYRKDAAKVWNDLGGWLSITILNGLNPKDRETFEKSLNKEITARGVGITTSTVRTMLERENLRPGKPGRPRDIDAEVRDAEIRAAFVSLIKGLQLSGLKSRAKRTRADIARLKDDPVEMVDKIMTPAA